MIRALVITHGQIGFELVKVVEMILGPTEGLDATTNNGKSGDDITQEVQQWLASNEGPALILVDDFGGSCAISAQLVCGERDDVAILCGVNLAMLLGFVTWRDNSSVPDLARQMVQKGREAIVQVGRR